MRWRATLPKLAAIAAGALALAGCAGNKELPMTTLAPKSDLARWIYNLFLEVTAWDALVMAVVLVSFFLAIFFFSTRVGEATPPSATTSNLKLEIAWTVVPALILLMITVPTVRLIFRSQPAVASKGSLQIEVVAHQWWWEFDYPDGMKTANELHLPVGREVRLNLRSADIIHSFWVPALGGKRDVIPGQINELTLIANVPGEYYGQCAEFCGLSHANMRFRVFVQKDPQFAMWMKHQLAPPVASAADTGPAAEGAKLFADSECTACHSITGVSKGYIGPNLTHFGSRTTLAAGVLKNTPANVKKWIIDPETIKPGAHMPALVESGPQLNDLVAYLESLK
ncbi:MAG: cytochrome c oxidase subunit II [Candidatus Binataceae bacterium]